MGASKSNLLVVSLSALIGAIFTGIVGNRADSAFLLLIEIVNRSIKADMIPWLISFIIFIIILLIFILVLFSLFYKIKVLNRAYNTATNIVQLDGSLLRLLAAGARLQNLTNDQKEEQIRRIILEIFNDVTADAIFGEEVKRISLLLPDSQEEYLIIWAHKNIPQQSVQKIKFYIGDDQEREIE